MDSMMISPCEKGVVISYFDSTAREKLCATSVFTLEDLQREAAEILRVFKGGKPH